MMRWIVAAAVAALGVAGEAQASDPLRVTIKLDWRHVPRGQDAVASSQMSPIPGGELYYLRFASGRRLFSIELADGHACSTSASRDAQLNLSCGGLFAMYELNQEPRSQATLDWVTSGPSRGKAPPSVEQREASR